MSAGTSSLPRNCSGPILIWPNVTLAWTFEYLFKTHHETNFGGTPGHFRCVYDDVTTYAGSASKSLTRMPEFVPGLPPDYEPFPPVGKFTTRYSCCDPKCIQFSSNWTDWDISAKTGLFERIFTVDEVPACPDPQYIPQIASDVRLSIAMVFTFEGKWQLQGTTEIFYTGGGGGDPQSGTNFVLSGPFDTCKELWDLLREGGSFSAEAEQNNGVGNKNKETFTAEFS